MHSQVKVFSLFCVLFCVYDYARAQASTLPAPARSVFKCESNGRVMYSDEPCRGGEKVDITPTRGMNKLSGKERTGADVSKEKYREVWSDALKPVTGLSREQYEGVHRRFTLSDADKRECSNLDVLLQTLESRSVVRAGPKTTHEEQTYSARQKYRALRC